MKITPSSIIVLTSLLLTGCSSTEMEYQFEMEKAINQANRLKQQFYLTDGKLSVDEYEILKGKFSEISVMIPPPPGDSAAIGRASEPMITAWQMAGLAYYNIGLLKMELEDFDGAYDDFESLIRHYGFKPHQVQTAMFMQALARYKQKRFSEAVLLYNAVGQYYARTAGPESKLDLDALESPLTAAGILRDLKEKTRFEKQLHTAIGYYWNLFSGFQGTPLGDAAVGKLAAAFLMGELADSAVMILSEIKDPKSGNIPPLVLLNIADIQQDYLRDYKAAAKCYREYLEDYPDHLMIPSALLGLGSALYAEKRYGEARDELSKIEQIRGAPDQVLADAGYLKALTFEMEDNWQRALGEFNYVQSKFPVSTSGMEAPAHVAEYYLSKGETGLARDAFADAERDYKRLVDMYSARPEIVARTMFYLARCAISQGKWIEAIDILKSLAVQYPDTPEGFSAYPQAADILSSELSDPAGAAILLKTFVRNYPRVNEIEKIIAYADSLEKASR